MFDHYIFLGGAIIKKDALLSLGKNFNPFEIELDKTDV